ncbi:unnamed protein product [Parnassius apollo]|uniref:(apollo) hypothetical protein n=1 Tax=Parnassius apollo TaxID=110799 RepID=A0A8S3YGI3_PARAO|nr:unnamed protein product [Parnassius apollo]
MKVSAKYFYSDEEVAGDRKHPLLAHRIRRAGQSSQPKRKNKTVAVNTTVQSLFGDYEDLQRAQPMCSSFPQLLLAVHRIRLYPQLDPIKRSYMYVELRVSPRKSSWKKSDGIGP